MKRIVLIVCAVAAIAATGCRTTPSAAANPTPVHTVPPGVIAPVDKARNTVDQLNQQQNQMEQQTGGNGYTP